MFGLTTLRPMSMRAALILGLLSLGTVQAEICPDYAQITGKLSEHYNEQRLFSGFADEANLPEHARAAPGASAIYELWANPERGTWSLISHKLLTFQDTGRYVTRSCTFVINAGQHHQVSQAMATTTRRNTTTIAVATPADRRCIPRNHLAQVLGEKYREVSIIQALADDDTLLEVFAGDHSWTLLRAKVSTVMHSATGSALRDTNTGQEIRRLCSTPLYSGKNWGLFTTTQKTRDAI